MGHLRCGVSGHFGRSFGLSSLRTLAHTERPWSTASRNREVVVNVGGIQISVVARLVALTRKVLKVPEERLDQIREQ